MPASASPPPSPPVRTPGQQPSHPASATNRSRTPQDDRFALYSPRNPDRRWIRGKTVGLYTKGWLPYTLNWQFRVTESRYPHGWSLEAWGDFVGSGIWRFKQHGRWVEATYDWKIRADKPLLRYLSPLLRPAFAANHRWAMASGEESLRLELARRRASTPEERARVPAPPAPTAAPAAALLAAGAATLIVLAALGTLAARASRRR